MTYPVTFAGAVCTPDGEVPPAPRDGHLNCGHRAPAGDGLTLGYGHVPGGYTACYPCLAEWERSWFTTAPAYAGYLTSGSREFTTWAGAILATVTRVTTSRTHRTPTGGQYRIRVVEATAPDGSRWHGRGSDQHDLITLRRYTTG
jgi:hypothetical protein